MVSLPTSPIRSGGREPRRPSAVLEHDGFSFAVHRSGRRATLQITVERSGELAVLAPQCASDADLVSFIREKLLWIHTKIEEKARLQHKAPVKEFVDGDNVVSILDPMTVAACVGQRVPFAPARYDRGIASRGASLSSP